MTVREPTDAEELLAFWVNGTLSEDEHAKVDRALAEDTGLRTKAEVLHRVRVTMQSDGAAITGPGEFGLARLHRELDVETRTAPLQASQPVRFRSKARVAFWAAGSAIAASLATVAVIGPGPTSEPFYEQASGEASGLVVTFAPDATITEIGDLIRAGGLTIQDGPSAMGLYRLIVLPGEDVSLVELSAQLEADERVLRVDIEE